MADPAEAGTPNPGPPEGGTPSWSVSARAKGPCSRRGGWRFSRFGVQPSGGSVADPAEAGTPNPGPPEGGTPSWSVSARAKGPCSRRGGWRFSRFGVPPSGGSVADPAEAGTPNPGPPEGGTPSWSVSARAKGPCSRRGGWRFSRFGVPPSGGSVADPAEAGTPNPGPPEGGTPSWSVSARAKGPCSRRGGWRFSRFGVPPSGGSVADPAEAGTPNPGPPEGGTPSWSVSARANGPPFLSPGQSVSASAGLVVLTKAY